MSDYQAVILAAGLGMRLRPVLKGAPKGLIRIGGQSLVERSVGNLNYFGIHDITIVTGYRSERYEDLWRGSDGIRLIQNDRFEDSSSMYSFYLARGVVDRPILLLESDLICEKRGIDRLLTSGLEDSVLLSGYTDAGDEVFVSETGGRITGISKDPDARSGSIGEWVGITKLSLSLQEAMFDWAEEAFQTSKSLRFDYETDCIAHVAEGYPIGFDKVEDLAWSEVDDEDHLRRMESLVYPRIMENDRAYPG